MKNEKNNHCIISEEGELNKYIQLSEISCNKNGVTTDDAVKNKAMHSEI